MDQLMTYRGVREKSKRWEAAVVQLFGIPSGDRGIFRPFQPQSLPLPDLPTRYDKNTGA